MKALTFLFAESEYKKLRQISDLEGQTIEECVFYALSDLIASREKKHAVDPQHSFRYM